MGLISKTKTLNVQHIFLADSSAIKRTTNVVKLDRNGNAIVSLSLRLSFLIADQKRSSRVRIRRKNP